MAISTSHMKDEFMFVLHPGKVVSDNDGQVHKVSASDLMRLHGVPARHCVMAGSYDSRSRLNRKLVKLEPRADGDYRKVIGIRIDPFTDEIKVKYADPVPVYRPPIPQLTVANTLC